MDEQLDLFPELSPVETSADTKVTGYRDLTGGDIAWMNTVKQAELDLGAIFTNVKELVTDVDQRCLSLAKTQFQTGFMWLVRSIARPEDSF